VNEPEVRRALLAAVPDLAAPPDRLVEVRRRAARRRTVRLTGGVVAGTLALVVFGGMLRFLSVGGTGTPEFGGSPSPAPSAAPSASPGPSFSDGPSGSGSPGASGSPLGSPSGDGTAPGSPGAGTGPLVSRDHCPSSLDLTGRLGAGVVGYHAGAAEVTDVTVCRYRHRGIDVSQGNAALDAGPAKADPAAVSGALVPILNPPPSNWNPEGCLYPSPHPTAVVDIVYAIDVYGRAAVYPLNRNQCSNEWKADPETELRKVVDRLLGPPY
jgi:hypothetical protein